METIEENSTDWNRGRSEFEQNGSSFRKIGEIIGLSHTAVAKRAKRDGWTRKPWEPSTVNHRCKPVDAPEAELAQIDPVVLSATVKDLTARGRNVVLALMVELEYLNQNASILMELVESNVNGEKDASIRAKLMKALDHEVRTKSSTQLATALVKLQDAAPSKKDERQDNAEKSASAGRFAAPAAPRTRLNS